MPIFLSVSLLLSPPYRLQSRFPFGVLGLNDIDWYTPNSFLPSCPPPYISLSTYKNWCDLSYPFIKKFDSNYSTFILPLPVPFLLESIDHSFPKISSRLQFTTQFMTQSPSLYTQSNRLNWPRWQRKGSKTRSGSGENRKSFPNPSPSLSNPTGNVNKEF